MKKFYLYDTLTRKKRLFKPLNPPLVTFYSCGPTVYDYTHIGHMRTFVNNDFLKRTLLFLGYKVKHVMNITDVGHLTGDSDTGEDKLEKGARQNKKTVWEVAEFYTKFFLRTLNELNIIKPDYLPRATEHVKEMIEIDKILFKKGFAYDTKEALYFDVSRFKDYGKLSHQPLEEKITAAREEVYQDSNKRNPADFSLWFKRVGRFKNHTMHWNSPWGDGFPGWHIECTAMSTKYLGKTLDIHSGGVEHIPVHHENEIAQAEAAFGQKFVRYWVHFQHLLVNGKKMSKSLKNFYTIDDLEKKGINPLSLRLFFAQTHYQQAQNFTWEAVKATNIAYKKIVEKVRELYHKTKGKRFIKSQRAKEYEKKFIERISDNLDLPNALALFWKFYRDKELADEERLALILEADKIFGLNLEGEMKKKEKIPEEIIALAKEREKMRKEKRFKEADNIRKRVEKQGWVIEDKKGGFEIKRR